KYFKGSSWGLNSIYLSGSFRQRKRSLSAVIKNTSKAIKKAEIDLPDSPKDTKFASDFLDRMNSGPEWCKDVIIELLRFTQEEMLDTLKEILPVLEEYKEHDI
ncbi:MAG: hypothetical protein V3S02_05430, partial [Dehalococcoidales bacterium]